MEPEIKKEHKYLPVLITVLVMLFVTAGAVFGTWYYMDQKAKNDLAELQKQIDLLQVNESKSKAKPETNSTSIDQSATTEVVPSYATNWYKFTSPNYGFRFWYPKITSGDYKNCSANLYVTKYENSSFPGDFWWYGNFFGINIRNSTDTISQIIKRQDPNNTATITNISNTGADEAVMISPAQNYDGYPPLAYSLAMFKKNGKLYSVMGFQDLPNYQKECSLGPNDGDTLQKIINSFRF